MLSLLASIYAKIADVRNRLYELGVFATYDLGARVISIGNITSGGTGKTPLVARVAEILADRGEKVCILTRGYGRENAERRVLVSDGNEVLADVREAGDEPFELANKLIGKALVIADADRVAAAEGAKRRFGVTAFVLDDGFQHRKAKR
ncbi:MAG TPA: tetraacyldisaccharide 4'-kinase, partial [Pyrinomonadaceae bacterium]|nr:tetraacyldisaccharide 4'-kinase [Pyrinomonadaceae bacterium]